jgi:regulator of protease activity HflC (stomatin/prohibitin superfamily)
MKKFILFLLIPFIISCTSVDAGHESPIISWGGETNMGKTLPEGLHWGISYLWDSTPEYEIREQTLTIENTYFDANNMQVPVSVTVYFNPVRGKTNYLHRDIGPNYIDVKLRPIVEGALAKVIPQFSAQDLNKSKREQAEVLLREILSKESANIYVDIPRVQFKNVTIPKAVADIAEETAKQLERNELATKKEAEAQALAKAKVAEAQGEYDAGLLTAKTRELLSQPKMLELKKLEIEEQRVKNDYQRAVKGVSEYGNNNVFGVSPLMHRSIN